jgi:hypothetical protein
VEKTVVALMSLVSGAMFWDLWHYDGVVEAMGYGSIPAWQQILFWYKVAVIAAVATTLLCVVVRGRGLAVILIPTALVLGLFCATELLAMFACHGCSEFAGRVLFRSVVGISFAVFFVYRAIALIKRGVEAPKNDAV